MDRSIQFSDPDRSFRFTGINITPEVDRVFRLMPCRRRGQFDAAAGHRSEEAPSDPWAAAREVPWRVTFRAPRRMDGTATGHGGRRVGLLDLPARQAARSRADQEASLPLRFQPGHEMRPGLLTARL